jgi:hypothetical protein
MRKFLALLALGLFSACIVHTHRRPDGPRGRGHDHHDNGWHKGQDHRGHH